MKIEPSILLDAEGHIFSLEIVGDELEMFTLSRMEPRRVDERVRIEGRTRQGDFSFETKVPITISQILNESGPVRVRITVEVLDT